MLVKLKVSRVGMRFTQQAGQVVDVSPTEAKTLIARHQAEAVAEDRSPADDPPKRGRKPKAENTDDQQVD